MQEDLKIKKRKENTELILDYIKKYDKFITKMAFSICRKCPKLEIEDVKQEFILNLLTCNSNYQKEKSPSKSTYFSQIVINCSYNIVRQYWQYKNRVNAEAVSLDSYLTDNKDSNTFMSFVKENDESYANPVNYAKRIWVKEAIEKLKAKLNNYEIKVFDYFLEGKTVAEIAKLVKKSTKTVYNVLSAIKEKTKDIEF